MLDLAPTSAADIVRSLSNQIFSHCLDARSFILLGAALVSPGSGWQGASGIVGLGSESRSERPDCRSSPPVQALIDLQSVLEACFFHSCFVFASASRVYCSYPTVFAAPVLTRVFCGCFEPRAASPSPGTFLSRWPTVALLTYVLHKTLMRQVGNGTRSGQEMISWRRRKRRRIE